MSLALWLIGAALAAEPATEPEPAPEPVEAPPPADGSGGIVGGVVGPPLEQPSTQDAAPAEAAEAATPEVHGSQVFLKVRLTPVYPEAAKSLDLGETACPVRFTIDPRGVPTAVDVSECPELFRASAEGAAWKWRFYPYKVDGKPTPVSFVMVLKYVYK